MTRYKVTNYSYYSVSKLLPIYKLSINAVVFKIAVGIFHIIHKVIYVLRFKYIFEVKLTNIG